MKKLFMLPALLCVLNICASDGASSSNASEQPGIDADASQHHDNYKQLPGMGQTPHQLHFNERTQIFPNARYEHNEPSRKDIHYSGTAKITQSPDYSPIAIGAEGAKSFVAVICQLFAQDFYKSAKDYVAPNEEQQLERRLQCAQAELVIKQRNQELQANEENLKMVAQIRILVEVITDLDKKENEQGLSAHEMKQRTRALENKRFLERMMGGASELGPAPAV